MIGGLLKKVPVFDEFLNGAKEGLSMLVRIVPSVVGLLTAVEMLKASGALDAFSVFVSPAMNWIGIPAETVPLMLFRPLSGSGAMATINNIFTLYGPDSHIGTVASVMMGGTETTFYTMAVYLGAANIKDSRYILPAALIADATGFIAANFFANLLL